MWKKSRADFWGLLELVFGLREVVKGVVEGGEVGGGLGESGFETGFFGAGEDARFDREEKGNF